MADDSLSRRAQAKALGGSDGKRAWSVFVAVLFLLPLAAVLAQYCVVLVDAAAAEREAVKELASPHPGPAAWGVLGSIRLQQGRIAEALPLLRKASDLELASGSDARDTLTLARACLRAADAGLDSGGRAQAEAALLRVEALAPRLPQGKRAASWFGAGLLWRDLGVREREVEDFKKAVAAQPDDWVDEGGGLRTKTEGLSGYYQKMLAGAQEP